MKPEGLPLLPVRCKGMRHLAAAVIAALLAAPCAASAQDAPVAGPGAFATLRTGGRGEVRRTPDRAVVSLTIQTSDGRATHAFAENNRRFAAFEEKLGGLGIPATDIESTSVESTYNPRPASGPIAAGTLYGYIVTRAVEVQVAATGQTGAVVDAATAAGVDQVNGVSFDLRDRAAAERAALAAAVADAQRNAQAMADAAHVTIVRVAQIDDVSTPPSRVMPFMAARAGETAPTTIAPSDLTISRSVVVTYVIR